MQTRLPDGSVMVCGGCSKDAQIEYVGDDGKRLCKVGLAVGKRNVPGKDRPETIWCNVVAWHRLAEVLAQARKGDPVFAIGRLNSREYQGKTYTDLVAEYINVGTVEAARTPYTAPSDSNLARQIDPDAELEELEAGEGKLPF